MSDPFVMEVLTAFATRENGMLEAAVGGSWETAPNKLVDGLLYFDRVFRRVTEDERERKREAARDKADREAKARRRR